MTVNPPGADGRSIISSVLDGWQRFWFEEIPPHSYALLRILLGLLGCASLIGLRNLSAFWALDGFVAAQDRGLGLKAWLFGHGLGNIGGRALFFGCLASFASMTVGFRSGLSVALALTSSLLQVSWNYLPLSGAHSALQAMLFCLIWADTGSVWSVDAWLARRRLLTALTTEPPRYMIAPLRLVRFQVALVYLNSGLYKLYNQHWRDGSAVHYILNNNVYRRFPHDLPLQLEWLGTIATYTTLSWELGFAFLVLFGPTRRLALWAGILLHLGMWVGIEIGPFPWVMLAGYTAFLDPSSVRVLPRRVLQPLRRWAS